MTMFDKFGDYMYSLLFTPLKKVRKASNQFNLFFKVVGRLFDDTKQDIFRVREEAMVVSASKIMLPEHGKDRDMPRLLGETTEGYRTRLSMKAIIAEMAGTEAGILLSMASLGYDRSYLEPMYKHDPERWAEFILFLGGDSPSVTDMRVIDGEVMKVKEASSMPAYAREAGSKVLIKSSETCGEAHIPLCNTLLCGLWPGIEAVGKQHLSRAGVKSSAIDVEFAYPMTNQVAASERLYEQYTDNLGKGHESTVRLYSEKTTEEGLIQ